MFESETATVIANLVLNLDLPDCILSYTGKKNNKNLAAIILSLGTTTRNTYFQTLSIISTLSFTDALPQNI